MTEKTWVSGQYMEAAPGGPQAVRGLTYRGLGFRMLQPPSSRENRPMPRWGLTHIGTGHNVAYINAIAIHAFSIATAVALSGDWSFSGINGFENSDPELVDRLVALRDLYGPSVLDIGDDQNQADEEQAREIAISHVC
jgi:hypothetical protein